TDKDRGTYNTKVTFVDVGSLLGGILSDSFVFSDAKSVTGSLDGSGGTDTLDYSAYRSGVTVNLAAGSATGVGKGISNLDAVFGGSAGDTLAGPKQDNTWNVTGRNLGTLTYSVTSFGFSSVENLTGGVFQDRFVFSNGRVISGTVAGGSGS